MNTRPFFPMMLASALTLFTACTTSADDSLSEAEVEAIVKNYLLENPEIIAEAISILRTRAETAQAEQEAKALDERQAQLTDNLLNPIGGNPEGDITIVEFFDYNCGYCRRASPTLKAIIEANPNLKVVYKEWPILSEGSQIAAQVALAVHLVAPERYEEFHHALLSSGSIKSQEDAFRVAEALELDILSIEAKLNDPSIARQFSENAELARNLGISGTPAFVIGGTVLRGAYPQEAIQEVIDEQQG